MHARSSRHPRLDHERLAIHRERLVRIAHRMCRSAEAAEDLVHDTFERVLRSPRRIRGDELGYLVRAMRNTHIDGVRAAARRYETVSLPATHEPPDTRGEDGSVTRLHAHEVLAAISALPKEHRQAVAMVDVWGISYKEAARNLGIPPGTVLSRAHRGRASVARALRQAPAAA
jgi:RNA polymerase sigma-70 factor, ECF subfamily